MNYLLLFLSVFVDTIKNTYYNTFSKSVIKSNRDVVLFNAVCGIGAVIFFCCLGCKIQISRFSLALALIYAAVTAGAQYFSLVAMSEGSMSLSVLFTYLGMIIPTLFGIIYYHQGAKTLQIIGLVLLVITIFMESGIKKNEKINLKWFVFALLSLVAWGGVGVVQLIHQNSAHAGELEGFLLWSFVFMTVIFAMIYFLASKEQHSGYRIKSKETIISIVLGVIIGAINLINVYLSGKLPSVIVFPVLNIGVILLSGIVALALFKEKLSKIQYIGIVLGVASMCMLGM